MAFYQIIGAFIIGVVVGMGVMAYLMFNKYELLHSGEGMIIAMLPKEYDDDNDDDDDDKTIEKWQQKKK